MRIVMIHNRYQQSGGEDHVLRAETELLRARGHEVESVEENNDAIVRWTAAAKAAIDCVYSFASARSLGKLIDDFRPDVAHIHNFFPRLSPSVHYACHQAGVPVVQTLHNYRLLCPGATLFREGKVCEDCTRTMVPWPAIAHACYRDSRTASAAVANMLAIHRAVGTWTRTVSRFITPTEFARNKFIEGGLPAGRIAVKANFLSQDPGMGTGNGNYALFVGRLSQEKGLDTLLDAWRQLKARVPLKIVGEGPLAPMVKQAAAALPDVQWLGPRNHEEVLRLMADAALLVIPNHSYETFGMVAMEAFAVGLPVLASRLGALAELVRDGVTGKLFAAGSSEALAATVEWAITYPDELGAMRRNARLEFESRYTADANYSQLIRIYESARGDNRARKSEAK
jgi:glycosyltransferase involved in cell wall biosynthesis